MTRPTDFCNCPQYTPAFLIPGARCIYCNKRPIRKNDIWCGETILTVQGCDDDEANIGMFLGNQSAYYHVDLPSLKRQWKPASFSWDALPAPDFDAVLAEYRDDILALIARLNGGQMTLGLEADA